MNIQVLFHFADKQPDGLVLSGLTILLLSLVSYILDMAESTMVTFLNLIWFVYIVCV